LSVAELIAALSRPEAYPDQPDTVQVCQTHVSAVFLAGDHAWKVKKPVNLGFLDFSTLSQRRFFCDEEVRLNRRLAPQVYLGVVPVTQEAEGLRFEGNGPVVEWAVKMRRLPAEATLLERLRQGQDISGALDRLARRLADFQAQAEGGANVARGGSFEVVAGNARENFQQTAAHVGITVAPAVHARLRELTEEHLARLRPLIEARAALGVPRDGHGDLHLDHVYYFPNLQPPEDLAVIDCIEFAERFRHADPVADVAFLVMDLLFQDRPDLARDFAAGWFRCSGDAQGWPLLPFYAAYRAVVRAKVEGMELAEEEVPAAERQSAWERARAHWSLALGLLEEPGRRPCLVLVGGLPGSGKSTLARSLAEAERLVVIRSDVVRKELAGDDLRARQEGEFESGLYTPQWTEQTYSECLDRAENCLAAGQRVLIDATFRADRHRQAFLRLAWRWKVPLLFIVCQAPREVLEARVSARRGDVSDAGPGVLRHMASQWESPGERVQPFTVVVDTGGTREDALAAARAALARTLCPPLADR